MAKAILVIDSPKSCNDCPVLEYCHNNDGKCDLDIKQPWCPLKEISDCQAQDIENILSGKDGNVNYKHRF